MRQNLINIGAERSSYPRRAGSLDRARRAVTSSRTAGTNPAPVDPRVADRQIHGAAGDVTDSLSRAGAVVYQLAHSTAGAAQPPA